MIDTDKWLAQWSKIFLDPNGGFFERLGIDLEPLPLARRLVGQCRQVYTYAVAMTDKDRNDLAPLVESGYQYIVDKYYDEKVGAYHYTIHDDGSVDDGSFDLYAQTFVIMAFIATYRLTGNKDALQRSQALMQVINTTYRHAMAGFYESLDISGKPEPKMRRQNPHMHFFEACMFAYEVTGDNIYRDQAREILGLMETYFVQKDTDTLCEFFTDDLKPDAVHGYAIEPGHHLEWSRFLNEYAALDKDAADQCQRLEKRLMGWVMKHGFDKVHGGVYDVVAPDGTPIKSSKRIWCQMEAMAALYVCGQKAAADELLAVLKKYYLRADGLWTEHLNEDMSVHSNFYPATTPYHIYFPIRAVINKGVDLNA